MCNAAPSALASAAARSNAGLFCIRGEATSMKRGCSDMEISLGSSHRRWPDMAAKGCWRHLIAMLARNGVSGLICIKQARDGRGRPTCGRLGAADFLRRFALLLRLAMWAGTSLY